MSSPERIARDRIARSMQEISRTIAQAMDGNPFAGETSTDRIISRLQSKLNISSSDAEQLCVEISEKNARKGARTAATNRERAGVAVNKSAKPRQSRSISDQEKVWGDKDFVSVAFLEKGARISRAVGRVAYASGRAQGTGILIGNGLFLTNHHVIETADQARQFVLEFDYEKDLVGRPREVTRFKLDPSIFVTDNVQGLDFTVIGVGELIDGNAALDEFGYAGLSSAGDKHMIGEFANIVQHPKGRFKEVVLRGNQLVNRFDDCLHYVADTEPGSSGSPVFNSEWQIIALHHWGGPWIDKPIAGAPQDFKINEGIRISSIVRHLNRRLHRLPSHVRERIALAITEGESSWRAPTPEQQTRNSPADKAQSAGAPTIASDGGVSWTIPLEISVRLPSLSAATGAATATRPNVAAAVVASQPRSDESNGSDSYSDRLGYDESFLPDFTIPMPELSDELTDDIAPLLVPTDQNTFELKYHHFSVVMNKRRRLAFYTACNIDGRLAKSIHRGTGVVSDLSANSPGLRESLNALNDAEADSWCFDPRMDRAFQAGEELYRGQKVPGFPNPRSGDRIARMFQKGHLVRRIDPAWGDENRAIEAQLDTFHWTNAAPQVGFFNQGTADDDRPGTGEGNLWRAAENYVLRNAVKEKQRVTSFTGPIFRETDRKYRSIQIPDEFFKVTAWIDDGELKSIALIVNQKQVFDAWPEVFDPQLDEMEQLAQEAFEDADEIGRVVDFLSTIAEVESLTGLDFGDSIRDADIRHNQERIAASASDFEELTAEKELRLADQSESKDDLTVITGLGRISAERLAQHGIDSFDKLAALPDEEAQQLRKQINVKDIIKGRWREQARKHIKKRR